MALGEFGFKVIPENPLEWERFFNNITVAPDADTVTQATIAADAVTSEAIADNAVTFDALQDLSADVLIGRLTTGGSAQELTAAQAAALLQAALEALDRVYTGSVEFEGNIGFYNTTPIAQPSHVTDASTAHALNATFSDTEVEAALDALGSKINEVISVLETLGLKANV